jgi:hypothetical protein
MALCGAGARDGRRDDGNACGKAAAAHWDRSDALRDRASSAAVSSFSLFGRRRRTGIVFAAFADAEFASSHVWSKPSRLC